VVLHWGVRLYNVWIHDYQWCTGIWTLLANGCVAVGGARVSHSTLGCSTGEQTTWSPSLHAERYCFVVRLFRYLCGRARPRIRSLSLSFPSYQYQCRLLAAPMSQSVLEGPIHLDRQSLATRYAGAQAHPHATVVCIACLLKCSCVFTAS
jgi:hypothetical protein